MSPASAAARTGSDDPQALYRCPILIACGSLLAYALGTAALAGGAPRGLCAAMALPPVVMVVAALTGSSRESARKLLGWSLLLAALGGAVTDVSEGLTLAVATQRGHVIRLLWAVLGASTLMVGVRPLLSDEAMRAAWRRWWEGSGSRTSAVAGAAIVLAGGAAVLGWLVGQYPLGPDAGVNVSHAIRVNEGRVPYVDFETIYHPGNCYVQAAWLAVLGSSATAFKAQIVLQHVWVAACLAVVSRVRIGVGGRPLALLIGLYFFCVPALEGLYLILEPMISCSGWAALALASLLGRRLRTSRGGEPADLLGGALVGSLAALALATKQPGGVFLAALPLAHLDAGRLVRPVLVAQLAGALLVPAAFFGAHPDALPHYWQQSVMNMFSYAQGTVAPKEPWTLAVASLARDALLPLALTCGLGLSLSELRRGGRPGAWGDASLLCAGALSLAPSFIRPYQHYYLLPLPFAVFALGLLARRAPDAWTTPLLPPAALAGLAFGLVPFVHYHQQTLGRDVGATHEGAVTSFIAEHMGGHDRALILPNTPEYYVLTGTRSPDEIYSFVDNQASFEKAAARFRLAREASLPAFLVDRGCPMLDACRAKLRELGYARRAQGPQVEYWACE